jgi:hypothetical protein
MPPPTASDEECGMFVANGSSNAQGHQPKMSRGLMLAVALLMSVFMSGCDQLGIDTPAKIEERATADAKAVGGACRHAMRAIEDCYVMNPKNPKAAVAAGWREMDEYMRENKLEGVAPTMAKAQVGRQARHKDADEEEDVEPPNESASSAKGKGKGVSFRWFQHLRAAGHCAGH